MNWFLIVLKKYADFTGRARRSEYWFYYLFYMIIYIALTVVEHIVHDGVPVLASLFALGMLVPSIAVSARRLHDTNRSGWWMLIGLVPLIGGIILLVFMCTDSEAGENRFGPNPKAAA